MTPISTTQWFMGFVNNVCPECSRGSLDQVPCLLLCPCPDTCLCTAPISFLRSLKVFLASGITLRWTDLA